MNNTIKIRISNSFSHIINTTGSVSNLLKNTLCYQNKGSNYSLRTLYNQYSKLSKILPSDSIQLNNISKKIKYIKEQSYVYLYNSSDNSFPTGLIKLVKKALNDNNISYIVTDNRKKPRSNLSLELLKPLPILRYFQKEALEICLSKNRATCEIATGAGKSLLALALICKLKVKTLFIVPSTNILQQIYKLFTFYLNSKHVGILGDGHKDIDKDIIVTTYQSLVNMDKKFFSKFKCLCLDEAHRASCETITSLNKEKFNNIYYRFFFTGTCYRNDGSDLTLLGVVSTIDYKYPAIQGIKDGYLSKPIFYIISNSLPYFNFPSFVNATLYSKTYKKYIVENPQRNSIIAKIAKKFALEENKSVLITLEHVQHQKFLKEFLPEATYINSKTDNNFTVLEKFNSKEIKILVGTDVIGEGVDTYAADALILAGAGKAKSNIVQKIGRNLRIYPGKKNAYIIDFMDEGNKLFNNQFKHRLRIYKSFKTEIHYIGNNK